MIFYFICDIYVVNIADEISIIYAVGLQLYAVGLQL